MASLLDWTLDSACCDHDVQNGLSKGCSAGVENFAQLTKDVYKGVRSLRAVYDKLVETMPTWAHRVRVTDSAFDREDVRRSWECLGVKPWLADSLAHINLRLEDGAIQCHSNLWEHEDPMGHLGNCLLRAYKIGGFSATRFLGMGTSCKGLSTAFAVGVLDHVAFCRAMPDVGEYYIHCVDLLNSPAKQFIFTTALATKVTDPLHAALLKDDRVAKNPHLYFSSLHDEVRTVSFDIPHLLYDRLASFIPGFSAGQLESNVLRSVYITTGYIDRRMFSIMRKPFLQPWRYRIET